MDILDAIRKRRSIRRFQPQPIPQQTLEQLLELIRFYPSGANLQPLRFTLVTGDAARQAVFACLRWAAYLPGYTMTEEERPTAYILIHGDRTAAGDFGFAAGAAAQTLMLGAQAFGLASCCLMIPDPKAACEAVSVNAERFPALYAIALGYPAQTSCIEDQTDTCRYRLDANGDLIVPKKTLQELLIGQK